MGSTIRARFGSRTATLSLCRPMRRATPTLPGGSTSVTLGSHGWAICRIPADSQVDAWNEGRHDGWLEAKRSEKKEYAHLPLTMGHYTREDLPFYYALADAFTVCDQNYCSVMTSTSPNRSYFWTGTIREQQSADSKVHIRNEQID